MKILVTGGAGFIGSHICHKLIELGFSVNCVDNLSTGKIDNIKDLMSTPSFKFYHEDVLELNEYHEACDVSMICHQAAMGSVPRSVAQPDIYQKNNVEAFFHLLEIARIKNIKRFVYASSSSVYGNNEFLPKQENRIGDALSPYAATKRINEIYAKVYNRCYGIETIGLRYFNVFGPKQNPYGDYAAVIPKFITAVGNGQAPIINGDGSYGRDFTYVDNAVQANILALTTTNPECFGEEFNIGAGGMTTIKQLFNSIRSIMKSKVKVIYGPVRIGDIPMSIASVDKARKLLKYTPDVDVKNGLEKTIKYFHENINNMTNKK